MKFGYETLLGGVLLALVVVAGLVLAGDRPALLGLGLGLSASAPLAFLIWTRLRPDQERRHPVLISVLTGFGCVMAMVGVHRFGDQHQWILGLALVALVGWMVYQRWIWRKGQRHRPG